MTDLDDWAVPYSWTHQGATRSQTDKWKGIGNINFRTTKEQREQLKKQAKDAGFEGNLSEYMRRRLLDGENFPTDPKPEDD